jgi:cytochrome d ubiquinol oxidase subunit I
MAVSYWSFRIMIGAGFLMLALAGYALYLVLRDRVSSAKRFLGWLPYAIALPYIANTSGWIFTEVARQPWIVFGLQRTKDAVSPNVAPGMLIFSLIAFTLIYALLMGVAVFLLAKYARVGLTDEAIANPA